MSLTRFKLSLAASMAMAAMAMTGVAAPGPSRGRSHPMRTSPGSPRPSRDKAVDTERMCRAEDRRLMRERKRLAARAAGGWVSSDAWLSRAA